MAQRSQTKRSILLASSGWKSGIEGRLLASSDEWANSPEALRHGHTIRKLFEAGVDGIFFVDSRPTVCVKDARKLNEDDVRKLRDRLWMSGVATLLMVERNVRVEVYSTFVTPKHDATLGDSILSEETIASLESAELALRVTRFIRRVETGAIYCANSALFQPNQAVDQYLLDNLKALRDKLCPKGSSLTEYERVHALIGKFLFSCYLLDRGIIGPPYLEAKKLPSCSKMVDFLQPDTDKRAARLEHLFTSLKSDFNGSLFGNVATSTKPEEVNLLAGFVASTDVTSGQLSLFTLYDFAYIPVELISSIYQDFLQAESDAESPQKASKSKSGQRTQGAYYTPTRLAELTVDIATEGWSTLLDKRCLDGACGSGIFLVILFVRMAEEWRRRNPRATNRERYDALNSLMLNNLVGIDTNLTACRVTCFSLYLAFLDQMKPREITELREDLDRSSRSKILPPILSEEADDAARLKPIRKMDFFDASEKPEFDLVIGNPPWVSRKTAKSGRVKEWIFSNRNLASRGLKEADKKKSLFPNDEVACGFMWKSPLHVKTGGRVCQVLPAKVFLSNHSNEFQIQWINANRLDSMWLLADYRFVLFPGADCPCFIGRYRSRSEGESFGEFEFVSPKVEKLDPREALIPVQPEDQKTVHENDIVDQAKRGTAAAAWKIRHWGTPRDQRLVSKLLKYQKLERLTYQPGKKQVANGLRQLARGQGFKPAYKGDDCAQPLFWNDQNTPFLLGRFKKRKANDQDDILLTNDPGNPDKEESAPEHSPYPVLLAIANTVKIGERFKEYGLHRKSSEVLFQAPMVLTNQGFTKFLFSDFNVLFQHTYQSISGKPGDEGRLLFLTALLGSPLAQYLMFHTSANQGIERDKVHFEEFLELPFPLPVEMPDPDRSQKIYDDCVAIANDLRKAFQQTESESKRKTLAEVAKSKLDAKVYDYYRLHPWEIALVEDTVDIFYKSSTPSSLDSKSLLTAQSADRKARQLYAETLRATFRKWSRTKSIIGVSSTISNDAHLAIVTLSVGAKSEEYQEDEANDRVESLLTKLRDSTTNDEGTIVRRLSGFMYFGGEQVQLLKPLSLRHWTRTTAFNDADSIMGKMLEENGWGL